MKYNKQPIFTPAIEPCAICGASAKCIDWNYNFSYRVMCDNNHVATNDCGSIHRAICLWNNKQIKIKKDKNE